LSAVGTSSNPVTFTGSGWGSIVFNGSGANGSAINYANISYSTEVDVISANNVTVQNCSITNSSGNGIYVYSSSNFSAQGNTITNNNYYCGISIAGGSNNNCYDNVIYRQNHVQQGIGIWYDHSSGSVARNDIAWCSEGILVFNGSSPTSWMGYNPPAWRNNRVTNCGYGLYVYNDSHPCFGVVSDSRYCYNSIVCSSNGTYSAYVGNNSSLLAHQNWWGSAPPPSKFYVGLGSSLDYNYWLTSDPWYGFPLHFMVPAPGPSKDGAKLLASVNTTGGSTLAPNSSNASVEPSGIDSLLTGIELRDNNKQKEAADFFRSYLNTHPDNQAAYVYLYSCANSETTPELIEYFKSLPKQAAKEQKLLLSYLYLMQGDVKSAKQVNNDVIDANPNARLASRAKLNNFYIALYNENDPILASSILSELMSSRDLSTPTELLLAQNALRTYVDPKIGKMPNFSIGQGSDGSVTVAPVPDELMMNYPNPFNPSTTIGYKLSSAGHVTLKVYDILGREVITLVDEYQERGAHTAYLNSQNLASGVYFYRLTAPGISQVKKMIMMK
jgi:parallel beta-helix repeat protein